MKKRRKRDKYNNFFLQKMAIEASLSNYRKHMCWLKLESIQQPLTQGPVSTHLYLFQNPKSEGFSMLSASLHADFVQIATPCFAIWNLAQGDDLHNFIATGWALYIACHESLSNKHLYDHSHHTTSKLTNEVNQHACLSGVSGCFKKRHGLGHSHPNAQNETFWPVK